MLIVSVVQHVMGDAHAFVRTLLKDLTDDEYFWEPAPGCWSVRRNREPFPPELPGLLGGDPVPNVRAWRVEHGWEWTDDKGAGWANPDPPPLTTIGWLLTHVSACQITYHQDVFDSGDRRFDDLVPTSASEAVEQFEEGCKLLTAALGQLTEDDLLSPWERGRPLELRQSYLPGEPFWKMFVGLAHHAFHHGAEIGRMRDLHRAVRRQPG